MDLIKINLRDSNFTGDPSCCHQAQNKYIEWDRGGLSVSDSCFITDMHLAEVTKCNAARKIAWLLEPRAIYPQIYDWIRKNNRLFDFVLTFDRELVESGENYLFYPHGRLWLKNKNNNRNLFEKKTKNCSIIASNKNFTVGHRMRHDVVRKWRNVIDVYGRGYKPIDTTDEALVDYRFSVTIENSKQDWYFSEKLLDCFQAQTVPIYWGCPDIGKFFDTEGMILFNSLEELENILNTLTPELYLEKINKSFWNFELVQDYKVPEDWMFENYKFLFT